MEFVCSDSPSHNGRNESIVVISGVDFHGHSHDNTGNCKMVWELVGESVHVVNGSN